MRTFSTPLPFDIILAFTWSATYFLFFIFIINNIFMIWFYFILFILTYIGLILYVLDIISYFQFIPSFNTFCFIKGPFNIKLIILFIFQDYDLNLGNIFSTKLAYSWLSISSSSSSFFSFCLTQGSNPGKKSASIWTLSKSPWPPPLPPVFLDTYEELFSYPKKSRNFFSHNVEI